VRDDNRDMESKEVMSPYRPGAASHHRGIHHLILAFSTTHSHWKTASLRRPELRRCGQPAQAVLGERAGAGVAGERASAGGAGGEGEHTAAAAGSELRR
jgi:hypothetical protein